MGIVKVSIKNQIYNIVKERIINQEYSFGEPINIVALSNELGTSNTPIREALNLLAAEGLISSTMNNKFKVVEIGDEDNKHINEAVAVLLQGGYASAYRNNKDDGLAELLEEKLKIQKEAYRRYKLNQTPQCEMEYIKAAMDFDRTFVVVSENPYMLKSYDNLTNLLYLYVQHSVWLGESFIETSWKEHEELVEAVRKRDLQDVIQKIGEHFSKPY